MATRPIPVPVPTPTPPKPAPKPAPKLAPNTGGSGKTTAIPTSTPSIPSSAVNSSPSGGYQQGGWYNGKQYWNGQFYDTPQQGASQSSGGDSGYQAPSVDFDAIYAPQFAALDEATNVANSNFGLASQDIATGKESQLRDVQSEQDKAQGYFDESNAKAARNKESAYSEAVRYFNAIQQRAKAQFGRGNSAGQAIGELGNQEFFKNQGNIEQSYADIQKELEGKWHDALATYSSTRLKIDEWQQTQLSSLKQNLSTQLLNIKMSKAQAESDKTAKKMEVLDRAREQVAAITAQKNAQTQALDTWKQQQQFLIQNKLVPIYNQTLNTQGATPTTSTISTPNQGTQGNSSIISTLRWNPNSKRFEDDNGQALGGLSYTA